MLELVHLVLNLLQVTKRRKRGFMNSRSRFKMYMLLKQSKFQALRSDYLALIGRFLAINEAKDRCLAGAIATYEPDVLAGVYLERSTTQNILRAVRFVDI